MPRMPQTKQCDHKHHDCDKPGYIYVDTATELKLKLLSDKIEAVAADPFAEIDTIDDFNDNSYFLVKDPEEGAKKILANIFINKVIDKSEVIDDMKDEINDLENNITDLNHQISTLRMDGGEII